MQDCAGASPPQTCTLSSPRPPREIIARERQRQFGRRAPNPAFHNIIPSELCNSRRHRHHPPGGYQLLMGQKPANTAFQASDYTIRIMLRTLRQCGAEVQPSNSRVRRRRTRHSREGGTTPPSTRERRTLRRYKSESVRIRGRKVQHRGTVIKIRPVEARWKRQCSAGSLPP